MEIFKDPKMSTTVAAPKAVELPTDTKPTTADSRIHWAATPTGVNKQELEEKFEAMRARNWITERMVQQYQKHWHCSREAALERLLAKVGA